MTDDLVKRLRDWEHVWPEDMNKPEGHLYEEAADRIEELEAKLAKSVDDLAYTNKRLEHAFDRNDRQAQTIDALTAREAVLLDEVERLKAQAVKVKPLEWKYHRGPQDTSEARTKIGSWTVWKINGSAYCYGPSDTCGRPCGESLQEAKAAAQADYEARILSAVTTLAELSSVSCANTTGGKDE